jgi:hypothetical protein
MADDELVVFLADEPARTGKLATVRADGRRNGMPGELVVRVRPTNIVAVAEVAD